MFHIHLWEMIGHVCMLSIRDGGVVDPRTAAVQPRTFFLLLVCVERAIVTFLLKFDFEGFIEQMLPLQATWIASLNMK